MDKVEQAVYISGFGIVSAIGVGRQQVLSALLAGQSGIGPLRYLDTIHTHLPAGEVKMTDEEMRQMLGLESTMSGNRTSLMGALALREALSDAGLDTTDVQGSFLISGTTVGGMDYTERYYLDMLERDDNLKLLRTHECGATTRAMAEAAGVASMCCITPSTACSSAANAIIMGCNLIKTGRADLVVAGGSEALSRFHFNGFNALMILDSENCRPFDATRAGLNLGEGAAFLVLESEASVRRRGIRAKFQVDGYGNACDAYHQTASSENGEGAFLAMREALDMAGLLPCDIDYVNAHGTGTPNNDVSESAALMRIFRTDMPAVSSTKSFTGHTTSASGSIESVICLLAMEHGFLPANLGWQHQMPDGITPTQGKSAVMLNHVMCNSFGFGGNDSCVILSKADDSRHAGGCALGRPVYVKSVSVVLPSHATVDVSDYVSKLESRRMCRLLKASIFTAMTALKKAGISIPDGIIVATEYGMLDNSEQFLLQMCRDGETLLKPTLFMQSTHNTIASTLATRLNCHGYNITFSDGSSSLQDALLDARLQIELGRAKHLLVGYHNECTPTFCDMERRLYGNSPAPGETSISLVLSSEAEGAICLLEELDIEALFRE